jgi:putative transport protein
MWTWIVAVLRQHPEMALFLTLAFGYLIGKIKIGPIKVGAVLGVLIAGVIIGQVGIKVSADLKTALFLLFLFSIGYRTGPQFFSGLRTSGFPQISLTVLWVSSALGLTYLAVRIFGFDVGTAGGLMAGSTSESAAVGTASDAIARLGFDEATTQRYVANVAVAFAVTYFLGVLIVVTFLSRIAPRYILGVKDLAAECAELERKMGGLGDSAIATGYRTFAVRAYRAVGAAGKAVRAIEEESLQRGQRLLVPRLRRGGVLEDAKPETIVREGDVLAVAGRRPWVIAAQPAIGSEVEDKELLDVPVDGVDVVVTEKSAAGVAIGQFIEEVGQDFLRGVGVRKIARAREELPLTLETKLVKGDVIALVGFRPDVERVAGAIGYVDRATDVTNLGLVAATVFVGGVIGLPALHVGRMELGLSQSVGVLLAGLVLGWLRSVNRRFPRLPDPALSLFDSLGLTAYLGSLAIGAGPAFLSGLRHSGLALVAAGVALVFLPHLITLLAGKYIFHMHPGILLGVSCGAGTTTPSLAAVQEVARSKIPTLGYTVPYAVGNIFLALWGSVIVALVH